MKVLRLITLFMLVCASYAGFAVDLDLDRNGKTETIVHHNSCSSPGSGYCLIIYDTDLFAPVSWQIKIFDSKAVQKFEHHDVTAIGDHNNDGISEVALFFDSDTNNPYDPVLVIVDLVNGSIIGETRAPSHLPSRDKHIYGGFISGTNDRLFPVMVPNQSSSTNEPSEWRHACIFRPGPGTTANADPDDPIIESCGPNFITARFAPDKHYYCSGRYKDRYYLGRTKYLWDMDKDHYDDIHIVMRYAVYTISGKTGKSIDTTSFNVAYGDHSQANNECFHSGRNYGSFSSFTKRGGVQYTALVVGPSVGDFSDLKCRTSRFVGVLETIPAMHDDIPSIRRSLLWADYFGI